MRAHERRFEKAQFEWYRELKTQSARLKENFGAGYLCGFSSKFQVLSSKRFMITILLGTWN